MKKIAILQSNYIPWKGYFDIIAAVDEFILYDDVQFTKNDWRNRNQVKTAAGIQWLTIPVHHSTSERIMDITVSQHNWAQKHLKTLQQNYARAAGYTATREWLQELYGTVPSSNLSAINRHFIEAICHFLGISTRITLSTDYPHEGNKTERVLMLCQAAGATEYLSGASAQDYLQMDLFADAGIRVAWADYSHYPEYTQLYPPFRHEVSIIDLILNCGPDAVNYLKYTGKR